MDTNEQQEAKHLLQRESDAKRYMLISFMFGVFFLATLKDLLSPSGLASTFIIIRGALLIAFLALTIYFYIQANTMLDEEESDKLDNYREALEKEPKKEEQKETFIDKYLNKPDLKSFKKTIYILWAIIFVVFMALAVLSFGGEPAEEPTDGTTKTQTTGTKTTAPAAKTPAATKPATTTK